MSHLVDTAEMYLKAVYELEEEGIPPLRARLVERLEQSKPTVSETVARLERDGLMHVKNNRVVALTEEGKRQATRVMRKHRLAERLLLDVLGMPWSDVHEEACRWEHVMSDAVEERLETLLEHTDVDPYGNPIPGIEGVTSSAVQSDLHSVKDRVARGDLGEAVIVRIAEGVQTDPDFLGRLSAAGIVPGARVRIEDDGGRVTIAASGGGGRPAIRGGTGDGLSLAKALEVMSYRGTGDGLAGGPCTAPVRVDASENGGEIRAARAWPPIGRQFMRRHACSHPAPRR